MKQDDSEFRAGFGFRTGKRGVHNTRTIMLSDLEQLFHELPPDASRETFRKAIVDDNVLAKQTASSRLYSFRRLAELYTLDPRIPLFRLLRLYWDRDGGEGRAIMAMLCALARDPILRLTAEPVLTIEHGERLDKDRIVTAVQESEPGRFSETSLAKIARMTASSWTQAGYLQGRYKKVRVHPRLSAATVAYALALGYLCGFRGVLLFDTFWSQVLDASSAQLHELSREASRRGLLTYRNAGGIVDVTFDNVMTEDEKQRASDQT